MHQVLVLLLVWATCVCLLQDHMMTSQAVDIPGVQADSAPPHAERAAAAKQKVKKQL